MNGPWPVLAALALGSFAAPSPGAERGAVATHRTPPVYPDWARGSGLSTSVTLRVLVGADGAVKDVRVVPYTTRDDILTRPLRATFDSAAVHAVRNWDFRPASSGGRRASAWTRVEVEFADPGSSIEPALPPPPHRVRAAATFRQLAGSWALVAGRAGRTRLDPAGGAAWLTFGADSLFRVETEDGRPGEAGRYAVSTTYLPQDAVARLSRSWSVPRAAARADMIAFAGPDTLRLWAPGAESVCDTLVRRAPR